MADEIHLTDVEILTPASSSGARRGRATTSEQNVAITESFESVFKRDYTPVARMAYLILGSTGEAEEVAQDAFAALLRRWDRIDNPSGFVRTAVLNSCRDIGRRRTVRRRALQRVRPVVEPSAPDASTHREVIAALGELDLALREVVVLRYYLDHTIDQIAALTSAPAGTVKSRLHRAIGQLGESLGSPDRDAG